MINDIKKLKTIDHKTKRNIELEEEELEFLYMINRYLDYENRQRKGYNKRNSILSRRDIKEDLARVLNCNKENIALSLDDFKKEDIYGFFGNATMHGETVPDEFRHLKLVVGSINFPDLIDASGLENLKVVTLMFSAEKLEKSFGLSGLEYVYMLMLPNLKEAINLYNLRRIGLEVNLINLKNSKGLENLEGIEGMAYFNSLEKADSLRKLKHFGHGNFFSLKSTKGLENLRGLDSANFLSLEDSSLLEKAFSDGYSLSKGDINRCAIFVRKNENSNDKILRR